MRFDWTGFNAAGKVLEGDIEAATMEEAAGKLREGKIFVSKIVPSANQAPAAPAVPAASVPSRDEAPKEAVQAPPPSTSQPAAAPPIQPAPTPEMIVAGPTPEIPAEQPEWWEPELEDQLGTIHKICLFASKFGVAPDVVKDAAKEMIRRTMVSTWEASVLKKQEPSQQGWEGSQQDQPATS